MSDTIKKINIIINRRTIPVNVTSEEEVIIRKVEKEINDKLLEYQKNFANQDSTKNLAMVALTYAMKAAKGEGNKESIDELLEKIDAIDETITEALEL